MKKYVYLFCLSVVLMLQACSFDYWELYKFENVPIKEIVPCASSDRSIFEDNGTGNRIVTVTGFKFVLAKPVVCSGVEVTEVFLDSNNLNAPGTWLHEYIVVMANPNTRYKFKELYIRSNGKQSFLIHKKCYISKL